MQLHNISELDKDIQLKIKKVYFEKSIGQLIMYGIGIIVALVATIWFTSTSISEVGITKLDSTHIFMIIFLITASVILGVWYITQPLYEAISFKKNRYQWGIGEITKKVKMRDYSKEDTTGFDKYRIYVENNECRCLIKEDFDKLDIGQSCFMLIFKNKLAYCLDKEFVGLNKYLEAQEREREQDKNEKKDIKNTKGIKKLIKLYDRLLDKADE